MKRERKYGIDLLRIVSMLMVLTLHVLKKGGILGHTQPLSAKYEAAWFLETASSCAVNCYAIISGYVGYRSKFKISSVISIWLQVVFYTLGITAIFFVCMPEIVTGQTWFKACFPVMTEHYWYFTAYFALLFFAPLLGNAIQHLNRRVLRISIWGGVMLFSVLSTVFSVDHFMLSGGYTMLWLLFLYMIGGYIHKYNVESKHSALTYFAVYLVMIVISWGSKFLLEANPDKLQGWTEFYGTGALLGYTSPTVLLAGIALVLCFAKLKFPFGKRLIALLAPHAFAAYLIHTQTLIWQYLFKNCFVSLAELPVWKMVGAIAVAVGVIYLLCTLIDMVRSGLFQLLHIKPMLLWLDKKLNLYAPSETQTPQLKEKV